MTEAGTWVVHVGCFGRCVVVHEEDFGAGGALGVEELEVVHGFPFREEALVVWVRYMFCHWAVVVDVVVAFVDPGVCYASDWVG